jgi:hypothetical protein
MLDHVNLNIEPCRSRILLLSGGGAHVLAGVAVAISSLPPWIKAGWIAAITLALFRFGWQYGYRQGRGFIIRLQLLDERWWLETGDGTRHHAGLTGGYAHPGIVILNFRLENGRRRSLALLPDAADPEALRRLRVWLRTRWNADGPNHA